MFETWNNVEFNAYTRIQNIIVPEMRYVEIQQWLVITSLMNLNTFLRHSLDVQCNHFLPFLPDKSFSWGVVFPSQRWFAQLRVQCARRCGTRCEELSTHLPHPHLLLHFNHLLLFRKGQRPWHTQQKCTCAYNP